MIREWLQEPAKPLLHLPENGDLVLASDRNAVEDFNKWAARKAEHRIHLGYLPEPYQGSGDAPVVLLSANPGLDINEPRPALGSPLDLLIRANLRQEIQDFPFYHLHPHLAHDGPGHGGHLYWRRRLWRVIAHVDSNEHTATIKVAHGVLCVEYFPYHTEKAMRGFPEVPSQTHTRELVRRIIEVGSAAIVVIRFWKLWTQAIPELLVYPRLLRLNSPQAAYLTPGNLPNDRFMEIVESLSQ